MDRCQIPERVAKFAAINLLLSIYSTELYKLSQRLYLSPCALLLKPSRYINEYR